MSSMLIHCLTITVSCTKSTWKATLRVDRHFNSSDKAPQLSSRLLQTVSNWLGGVFVELVDFLFSFLDRYTRLARISKNASLDFLFAV